jgi:iron complex outermembrane receptor protein
MSHAPESPGFRRPVKNTGSNDPCGIRCSHTLKNGRDAGVELMLWRLALSLWFVSPLAFSDCAFAQEQAYRVRVGAGPLPVSLQQLQRQMGIELLFDPSLVSGLDAPAVVGDLSTEAALRQLLAQSGLTLRRASSSAWIIERPNAEPLEEQDAAAPEIIVIGRRSQNSDIRRFENDVQPYVVLDQEEIRSAHRDNIDQIFNSRITANTTVVPRGLGQGAETRSEIDLRGLGSQNTLVLVDGRRMPSAPFSIGFRHGDINAFRLHAVKRIEVLTGSAGGIHGFGALGGSINVVLDREHRGFDLYITEGISSRGDAQSQGIEASFGYTSDDGATDFTIFAAHSEADPLHVGDRDFEFLDRQRTYEIVPEEYLRPFLNPPHGDSITVLSSFGDDLVFKPEFGSASLGSSFTFLPVGFSGAPSLLADALAANAGQVDFNLSDGARRGELTSSPQSDAVLFNLRHRFNPGLEVFADAALLRGRGHGNDLRQSADLSLGASSPLNPFTTDIDLSFPVEGGRQELNRRVESQRFTAGVLADLPFAWRGTAEASSGSFRYRVSSEASYSSAAILLGLFGDPDVSPLGNWDAFQDLLASDTVTSATNYSFATQFDVQSLRLAGPVFNTPAGPATLTVLAEHRSEEMPPSVRYQTQYRGADVTSSDVSLAGTSSDVTSLYSELRVEVFGDEAPTPLLRGLELQLAARRDEQENVFPHDALNPSSTPIAVTFTEIAYTAGFKLSPTPWLMLRGSYATGEQPPELNALQTVADDTLDLAFVDDPHRGGFSIIGPLSYRYGGSLDLDTVRAETVFVGAVLTPFGDDGLRFSIDISRIRRTGDVIGFQLDDILAHEEYWPERVTRGPLSDEDIALGYTAGPILAVDARYMNGGALEVDAVDLHAQWPMTFFGGRLRLYADATYHMRNVIERLFQTDFERTEYFEGPLTWRANGGFGWSRGDVTVGANVQYFGSYPLIERGLFGFDDNLTAIFQGSDRVEAQTYLDLHASWRLPIDDQDVTIDFGVVNVLDTRPSRETRFRFTSQEGASYSRYGDPRQRRFELVVRSHF